MHRKTCKFCASPAPLTQIELFQSDKWQKMMAAAKSREEPEEEEQEQDSSASSANSTDESSDA